MKPGMTRWNLRLLDAVDRVRRDVGTQLDHDLAAVRQFERPAVGGIGGDIGRRDHRGQRSLSLVTRLSRRDQRQGDKRQCEQTLIHDSTIPETLTRAIMDDEVWRQP